MYTRQRCPVTWVAKSLIVIALLLVWEQKRHTIKHLSLRTIWRWRRALATAGSFLIVTGCWRIPSNNVDHPWRWLFNIMKSTTLYTIEKSRYGLYTSVFADGTKGTTALTRSMWFWLEEHSYANFNTVYLRGSLACLMFTVASGQYGEFAITVTIIT